MGASAWSWASGLPVLAAAPCLVGHVARARPPRLITGDPALHPPMAIAAQISDPPGPSTYKEFVEKWIAQHSADAKSPLQRPAIIKEFGSAVRGAACGAGLCSLVCSAAMVLDGLDAVPGFLPALARFQCSADCGAVEPSLPCSPTPTASGRGSSATSSTQPG